MLSQELFSLLIPCTLSHMVVEECVSRTEQEVDSFSDIDGDSEVKSSILEWNIPTLMEASSEAAS